jgi:hypothetical protein
VAGFSPAKLREKVERKKSTIHRIEATLEDARRDGRRALLEAYEAGVSVSTLQGWWSTSANRMRENLSRAREEREGRA